MEIETSEIRVRLEKRKRTTGTSLFTFDIPSLIRNMKNNHTYVKGELNAMILLQSPDKQIVLTVLHEKTEINSFQSGDSLTLQIIEGKLEFHTREKSVIIEEGQSLTLHENIEYNMKTLEDTVFLLTIANSILQ